MADFNWVHLTITAANGGESLATGVYSRTIGTPPNQTTESKRFITLYGGTGDDTLTGGNAVNILNGQFNYNGSDYLDGNDGNDNIYGAGGDDQLVGGNSNDVLNGGDDNDSLSGGNDNDTLNGGSGNDTLNGNEGADVLNGGAGNDILSVLGGVADVSIDGGDDFDTLVLASGVGFSANLAPTAITNVERLALGNGTAVTITAEQLNAFQEVDYVGSPSGAGFTILLSTAGTVGANILAPNSYGTITGSAGVDVIDVSHTGRGWSLSAGDDLGGNVLTGGTAGDTLSSGEGGDTLNGNSGGDTLNGNGGNDVLNGGDDNDSLSGGNDNDTLNGGSGNDTLNGNEGADVLNGGAGNDILSVLGGVADVSIDGGDDFDTLVLASGVGFSANLAPTAITNVERLALGNGTAVTITAEQLNAFQEVDYVGSPSGAGFTILLSTAGTVGANILAPNSYGTITGSAGVDVIDVSHTGRGWSLSAGDDLGGNVLTGGTAGDTLSSGEGGDTLNGNSGGDTLNGNGGNDVLNGGDDNDSLSGGNDNDTLNGGSGNDTLNGNEGADVLNGGAGNDILSVLGGVADVSIDGGDDFDTLVLASGVGFSANLAPTAITNVERLALGNGTAVTITAEQLNAFQEVDYVGSPSGAGFTILLSTAGTVGANILAPNSYGTITGSAGVDVIDVSHTGRGWSLSAGDDLGGNVLTGGTAGDTLSSGEGGDTLNGNSGGDTLNGNGGNDVLNGGDDNDSLSGGNDNDTLNGGSGNDTLNGNEGADVLNGGAGNDILSVLGGVADVSIDGGDDFDTLVLASGVGFSANLAPTAITNVERLALGNGTAVTITAEQLNAFQEVDYVGSPSGAGFTILLSTAGTVGANILAPNSYGTITGSAGVDVIDVSHTGRGWSLSAGDDLGGNVLTGGTAGDTLSSGEGGDTLNGNSGGDTLNGNGGNDVLNGGDDNDSLSGGNDNDTLNGGSGNDTLNGNEGADVLNGGAGNDILSVLGGVADVSIDGGDDFDTLVLASGVGFSANLAPTAITNVERLALGNGTAVTITAEQLNAFQEVDYVGSPSGAGFTILLSTAGTVGANILAPNSYGTITGSAGVDVIDVSHTGRGWSLSAGDDLGGNVLTGGTAGDTLSSGEGGDTLNGNSGGDTLNGNGGNDVLNGGDDNDSLSGGNDNDTLNGGSGNDTLNGNEGVDTASYDSGNAVTVDLGIVVAQNTVGAGLDALNGIENLLGSAFNDTLTGSTADNALKGGNGDDILSGSQGNDLLEGGLGDDTLNGDGGEDTASYESSLAGVTVSLAIATAQDTGAGIDILSQIEHLIGSAFNDVLSGSSSANMLFGAGGNDSIDGSSDNDTLYGGSGNDTLTGGTGNDLLDGGDNIDTVSYAAAAIAQNVNLSLSLSAEIGGQEVDTLLRIENVVGSDFNDILLGDAGSNQLDGSNGADSLAGDAGSDTLNGGSGNDTINGDDGNDVLSGGDDRDVISGGNNNDTIDGGLGNDSLSGDLGNDFLDGNLGNDTLDGGDGNDVLHGGDGNDSINGGNGNETIDGSVGNDTINGSVGNDIINGGTGRDRMIGGSGNDFYTVDDAGDVIIELAGEGAADTVNTALASLTLAANIERLNYIGSGNFVGIGNSGDNRFTGGAGADRFVDVLGGNDTISGGNGSDSMDFRGSATGVVINFITNVHGGAAAGDVYASIEKYFGSNTASDSMTGGGSGRFIFTGGGGNDTLVGAGNIDNLQGQAGDDSINGLAGIDTIDGGAGNDTLSGGAALDYFVYSAASFGQDVITDFQDGLDKLKVHSSIANNISAFNIVGNGTTNVLLAQISSPTNTITLQGASAITITAADFLFY